MANQYADPEDDPEDDALNNGEPAGVDPTISGSFILQRCDKGGITLAGLFILQRCDKGGITLAGAGLAGAPPMFPNNLSRAEGLPIGP